MNDKRGNHNEYQDSWHFDRRIMDLLRRWSRFMDDSMGVPGTNIRFGWDPIIGLIPGLGDLIAGAFPIFMLFQAFRMRVPKIIVMRMILNIMIDVLVGLIPFLGDFFDFAWKSNLMNLALLEKHAWTDAKPGFGDYAFVTGAIIVAAAIVVLPVILMAYLFSVLWSLFGRWIDPPSFWRI